MEFTFPKQNEGRAGESCFGEWDIRNHIQINNNYETFYGEDNLRNILNKNKDSNLENISDNVQDDIKQVIGDVSQYDDETLLILKYE